MLRLIFLQEEHKMDSQNETAQLRYLEETSIRLRRMDFETMPAEDQQLPVKWNGSDLCRISGKGSVLYRQENVDSIRAQDALQVVIDTAKMTSEYMAILETAPRLKASGLDGDYRVLADFSSAVLAGHPTERGVQFVTWEWDFDREGVHLGHYFQNDEEEKMMEIYGTIHFKLILPHFPGFQQEPLPAPVCSHSPDCKDCPYPRHGFLCWGADGTCLRSRMNEINEKEDNDHDESSSE